MEVWKTITDFTNYEVSNYGNVRRKKCQIIYSNGMITNYKDKLLTQELNRKMYKRLTFSQNNIQKRYQVHRLVALYFIPNPENKPCVNHIDGDKTNNNISNLEWVTNRENSIHYHKSDDTSGIQMTKANTYRINADKVDRDHFKDLS